MKTIIGVIIALTAITISMSLYTQINFERNCLDYLKRAADASNVTIAMVELGTALDYLEENDLTSGHTSVLYNTPDEDIKFWYYNLLSSYEGLSAVDSENGNELEKSNMLMKLRETIIDHKSKGDVITVPTGISRYPYNGWYAVSSGIITILLIILGLLVLKD